MTDVATHLGRSRTATRTTTTSSAAESRLRAPPGRPAASREEGYEEARRVWNGAIDRRPALIARCAGADDVLEAVRFARERDLPVSVRGGGHAVAGHAVVDGGLMIDLSLLKAIRSTRRPAPSAPPAGSCWASWTGPPSGSGWPSRPGS